MLLFGRPSELSNAELLLLSKFLSPSSPTHFEKSELWTEALGRSPQIVITDFSKRGLLERPSLHGLIEGNFTVGELKNVMKQLNLPTSGKKADLAARLVANDAHTAEQLVRNPDFLVCSPEGVKLARDYLDNAEQDRMYAEASVIAALEQLRFEDASRIVAIFEANQVFMRGMGIDWNQYDPGRDIALLQSIFSTVPKLLETVLPDALPKLRLRAGVLLLWGTNRLKGDLAEEFESGSKLDITTAARMLLFHAFHLDNMREYKELGAKSIRFLTANDENVCSACRQLSGKVLPLDQVPELPYVVCTSELGCRCTTAVEEFGW